MHLLCCTPEVDINHDSRGFIHTWMKELAQRCDSLTIITLRKGHVNLPKNVSIYAIPPHPKLFFIINFYRTFFCILWKKRIDVIFVHMIPVFAILIGPIAMILGKPIVLWYTHGHVSLTLRLAHFFVSKVVTASKESFRITSRKKIVLSHGIDTNFFTPTISPTHPTINLLSIGRISPSKDYKTVIHALSRIIRKIKTPIHYTIVGRPFENTPRDIQYSHQLQQLVQTLALHNTVHFLDAVPHHSIVSLYQQCDIFINPSLTGSLDKAGLEAMSCAKPLLTCNRSYLEIFNQWANKLFFQPGDNSELSAKIIDLIEMSPTNRESMGFTLRQVIVEKHNLNQLMDKLITIFRCVAQRI